MARRTRAGRWLDRRRRYRRNESPPPVPDGWVTGPPDLVGVGAQKAGTSWWFELVVSHPGMARPHLAHKELRYFNRFATRPFGPADVERYHRLLARPPGLLSGEWTPSYMVDHWVPPLLHRAAPDARLVAILRDPVDRYVSGLAQFDALGRTIGPDEHRRAFEQGCYAGQIERLLAHYPSDQLLVLLYEDCTRHPTAALERTFAFLGLDPDHRPADLTARVHGTERDKPVLEADRRLDLTVAYRAEVDRLAALVPSLDLGVWPTAAG